MSEHARYCRACRRVKNVKGFVRVRTSAPRRRKKEKPRYIRRFRDSFRDDSQHTPETALSDKEWKSIEKRCAKLGNPRCAEIERKALTDPMWKPANIAEEEVMMLYWRGGYRDHVLMTKSLRWFAVAEGKSAGRPRKKK